MSRKIGLVIFIVFIMFVCFIKFDEVDEKMERFKKEYPSIISKKIHHSRDVERMNAKGQYIIKKLFQAYYSHPQQLPDNVIVRYMVDMGCYPSLNTANEVGTGSVRIKFENFFLTHPSPQKLH